MGFAKVETGGIPFLKKTHVQEGLTKVTIKEQPEEVETEYEGKKSMKIRAICSTEKLDIPEVKWDLNNTSRNFLIDKFGAEPKDWVGKVVELAVKQAGSSQPGIYPKDCSLERVLS